MDFECRAAGARASVRAHIWTRGVAAYVLADICACVFVLVCVRRVGGGVRPPGVHVCRIEKRSGT